MRLHASPTCRLFLLICCCLGGENPAAASLRNDPRSAFRMQGRQQGQRQLPNNNDRSQIAHISNDAVVEAPSDHIPKTQQQQQSQLTFQGEFSHNEERVPQIQASTDQLFSFFKDPIHRDHLLKGGGNPTERVPATPELYEEWRKNSHVVSSSAPDQTTDRTILAIHSTVSLLPGLSVRAISLLGCKLLPCPKTSLPMYEFTLIKESYLPQGPKAIVWVFNQIMAGGSKRKGSTKDDQANDADMTAVMTSSRQTHSLSRISMEPDHETGGFRLCYFGSVKVSCQIPRRILSVLPLSQKKVEAKVSKAMVQQLKREGVQSIQKFGSAMEQWIHKS